MKFTILIILLCIARTFCDESSDCYVKERERCDHSLLPTKIPDTIEELKRDCKNLITYGTCNVGAQEVCDRDVDLIAHFRNVLSYLNSTCQDDSRIFKVVTRNFDCISSAITNLEANCRMPDIGIKSYIAIQTKAGELGALERPELLRCLENFLEATCKSTLLGEECGEESEKVLVEFMANTQFKFGKCVKEFPKEWEALYEVFQTVVREERQLVKALEERKR